MNQFDYDSLRFWADALYRIATLAGLVWLAINSRVKANKATIDAVAKMVAEQDRRIVTLETRGATAPSHKDLGKMYDAINGLRTSIAEIGGALRAVQKSVDLLNEHHLNRRGKR